MLVRLLPYATTASGIVDVVTDGTTLFIANATRIYYQTIGATGALTTITVLVVL
jgi:hypothetical protein